MRGKKTYTERRCTRNCPHYQSTVKEDKDCDHVGKCTLFHVYVKDSLCGCRIEPGRSILKNFGGVQKYE